MNLLTLPAPSARHAAIDRDESASLRDSDGALATDLVLAVTLVAIAAALVLTFAGG